MQDLEKITFTNKDGIPPIRQITDNIYAISFNKKLLLELK